MGTGGFRKAIDWSPIGVVTLNPERDAVIRNQQAENKAQLAA